tara:strand:- start:766 stop:999 length:234 start_codon:yes stop_codon:yes gene_type:complete
MDKYILRPNTQLGYSVETVIDELEYSINITLPLQDTGSLEVPFSATITVISNNSQTGFEVDTQRQLAVDNYLIAINQ